VGAAGIAGPLAGRPANNNEAAYARPRNSGRPGGRAGQIRAQYNLRWGLIAACGALAGRLDEHCLSRGTGFGGLRSSRSMLAERCERAAHPALHGLGQIRPQPGDRDDDVD
jgi:hypothetical protein